MWLHFGFNRIWIDFNDLGGPALRTLDEDVPGSRINASNVNLPTGYGHIALLSSSLI